MYDVRSFKPVVALCLRKRVFKAALDVFNIEFSTCKERKRFCNCFSVQKKRILEQKTATLLVLVEMICT